MDLGISSYAQRLHKIKKSLTVESVISFGIVTILFYPIINGAIYSLFDKFQLPGKNYVDTLLFVLDLIFIMSAFAFAVKKEPRFIIATLTIAVIVIIAEIFLFPANYPAIREYLKDYITMCLPAFCIAFAVQDSKVILKQLYAFIYIPIFAGLVYGLFAEIERYSMWYGYSMVIPMLILGFKVIKNYRIHDIALFIVLFVLLMLKASRGSVLSIMVILFIYMFYYSYQTRNLIISESNIARSVQYKELKNRYYIIVLAVVSAVTVAGLLQPAAQVIQSLLLGAGINSRTIWILANQGIFFVGGRDVITSGLLTAITKSPLWGLGLCGDSVYTATVVYGYPHATYMTDWHYLGNYAHNIVLELTSQFGILLGLGLFIGFVLILINAFRRTIRNKNMIQFELILLLSSILFSLMVSGSYLITPVFWILLGLAVKDYHSSRLLLKNAPVWRNIYDVI